MTTPAIFQPRAGLPRTFERLRAQKQLAVGYFGGSISEGAGASDAAQTSWRALTTAWFACQFPGADIREVSAALGGTGSPLGAFRLQNDLLRFAPDLTFIEFAVNDDFDGQAQAARARRRALEGIVRRIRANLPQSEIVFTYTLTESMSRALGSDGLPRSTQLHEEIARHYAIPAVNVGQALLEQIAAGAGDWPHFTTDGVHPNDAGYRVYADAVQEFLAQLQSGASALSASAQSASAQSASAQSASAQSASALSASALSASAQSASAQSASAQSASALRAVGVRAVGVRAKCAATIAVGIRIVAKRGDDRSCRFGRAGLGSRDARARDDDAGMASRTLRDPLSGQRPRERRIELSVSRPAHRIVLSDRR